MKGSRTASATATLLILILVVPTVCLAIPFFGTSLPGSCHGHHSPLPNQSHRCCYSKPLVPTSALTVQIPVLDRFVSRAEKVTSPLSTSTAGFAFAEQIAFSPPATVLRV